MVRSGDVAEGVGAPSTPIRSLSAVMPAHWRPVCRLITRRARPVQTCRAYFGLAVGDAGIPCRLLGRLRGRGVWSAGDRGAEGAARQWGRCGSASRWSVTCVLQVHASRRAVYVGDLAVPNGEPDICRG